MPNFGGWQTPFPMRMGGRAHETIDRIYQGIRENIGSALSDDDDALNVADDKAAARLIAYADRFVDASLAQADPMQLTTLLERQEKILAIVKPSTDTDRQRRVRVASRLVAKPAGTSEGIYRLAEAAFSPWLVRVHETPLASAEQHYPGTSYSATTPWFSTTAHFVVEYERPTTASDEEVESKRNACREALDEQAAGWATFDLSETTPGYEYGFTIGVSRIGYAAIGG